MNKEEIKEALKEEDLEDVLEVVAELINEDLDQYRTGKDTHPGVINCLEGAVESCRIAAFNWYASFK